MRMLIWKNIARRRTQSALTIAITMLTVMVFWLDSVISHVAKARSAVLPRRFIFCKRACFLSLDHHLPVLRAGLVPAAMMAWARVKGDFSHD